MPESQAEHQASILRDMDVQPGGAGGGRGSRRTCRNTKTAAPNAAAPKVNKTKVNKTHIAARRAAAKAAAKVAAAEAAEAAEKQSYAEALLTDTQLQETEAAYQAAEDPDGGDVPNGETDDSEFSDATSDDDDIFEPQGKPSNRAGGRPCAPSGGFMAVPVAAAGGTTHARKATKQPATARRPGKQRRQERTARAAAAPPPALAAPQPVLEDLVDDIDEDDSPSFAVELYAYNKHAARLDPGAERIASTPLAINACACEAGLDEFVSLVMDFMQEVEGADMDERWFSDDFKPTLLLADYKKGGKKNLPCR